MADTAPVDNRTTMFQEHKPRLSGIAYRMLGSRADAEDVLQEAYLRWHQADIEGLQTPEAWLVTTRTRLCIDRLRALRVEREAYIGPWLSDPLLTVTRPSRSPRGGPCPISRSPCWSSSSGSPQSVWLFLLHDVFDCGYAEVARILGKTEAACRQMVHRARVRVRTRASALAVSDPPRLALSTSSWPPSTPATKTRCRRSLPRTRPGPRTAAARWWRRAGWYTVPRI